MVKLTRGTKVRVNTPNEPRFHGRTGTVVSFNLGEVGVRFSSSGTQLVWFLPQTLETTGPG